MRTLNIDYHDGDTLLEGYLAYNADISKPRPAVLVAHDWSGKNEFACLKAKKLAQLGYIGFAIDMFGKGILGHSREEKSVLIKPFIEDRQLLTQRALSAYEALKKIDLVDTTRIAAIGFCFGGMCVLDLARTGISALRAVVSFHGLLDTPKTSDKINAKILALHGHDDPMVPPKQVAAFQKEMTDANADWQMHTYSHTMHGFTNPEANDKDFGTVYNESADKRSWIAMQNLFTEVFL